MKSILIAAAAFLLWAATASAQPTAPPSAVSCGACHGANGISAMPTTPNLAGQKAPYLEAQLRAYQSKDRHNDTMNAMAASLTDDDIKALAAYYAALPGGG